MKEKQHQDSRPDHVSRTIKLPESCGLVSFEELLLQHSKISSETNEIVFDFSDLQWIGVLQISLLYGWICELLEKGKKVNVSLPVAIRKLRISAITERGKISHDFSIENGRDSFSLPFGKEKLKLNVLVNNLKIIIEVFSKGHSSKISLPFEDEYANTDALITDKRIVINMPSEGRKKMSTVQIEDKKINLELEDPYQAIWFLARINFFDELNRLGVIFNKEMSTTQSFGLAAFKSFQRNTELLSYEEALGDPTLLDSLLGGGTDADIIKDGDLREILLHELGDNAFLHGKGKNIRFAISEFPAGKFVADYDLLSSFNGRSYIETVISDSGPGLLKKLKVVPEDYIPEADIRNKGTVAKIIDKRNIAKELITAAYAFEFSSTSDEEGRKARLAQILEEGKELIEVVPTGLFYVAALARLHGGQIIVRTGSCLISLDFSKSARPIISKFLLPRVYRLASVKGTHILVRVPKQHHAVKPVRWELPAYTALKVKKDNSISLGEIKNASNKNEEFLLQVEKEIEKKFLKASKQDNPIVIILSDGLHVDTKTFSLLLITLSVISRRNCALLMLGLKNELMSSALEQWKRIRPMLGQKSRLLDRVHGYRSFPLVSNDLVTIAEFGDSNYYDSTRFISDRTPSRHLEIDKNSIYEFYKEALEVELKKILDSSPIKHPPEKLRERYYLIEGKYYTKTFYEIGKLISNQLGRSLSINYFRIMLSYLNIGSVFVISEPLNKFLDEMKAETPDISWHRRDIMHERSSFREAISSKQKNKKLMILTDVICTANEIQKFLDMVEKLDEIIIGCFVDGREESLTYVTVKREKQPHSVAVISVLKREIQPIYDLPYNVRLTDVLIIDKRTHAPTPYDYLERPEFSTEKLIEKATEYQSLFQGHFEFHGKHYSHFLYFARLFRNMKKELEEFWDAAIHEQNNSGINNDSITLLYLDEKRGWEKQIAEYYSTRGLAKCEAITRENLDAPPEAKKNEARKSTKTSIWIILPAIASGKTTQLCLEYASRYEPELIYISTIIARMDSTQLSFYQNIKKYRDCRVVIRNLSYLPIAAYPSKTLCPLCDTDEVIEKIRHRVEGYDYLTTIVVKRGRLFKVSDISMMALEKEVMQPASNADKERLLMRVHYEEAIRSIEHRKEDLKAKLEIAGGTDIFIDMVGREFLSDRFSDELIKRATYTRYQDILSTIETLLRGSSAKNSLSLTSLFGIHRLNPDLLQCHIRELFHSAIMADDQTLCEDITFLALLFPELYGIGVAGWLSDAQLNKKWINKLIEEIRLYPYWQDSDSGYAVREFLELLWLLRRSTPWGGHIENLLLYIPLQGSTDSEIRSAFDVLERNGIKKVLHHINQLKSLESKRPGSLWSALMTESPNIEETVDAIQQAGDLMRTLITSHTVSRDRLLSVTSDLDACGKQLGQQLTNIFTNPIDVRELILKIKDKRWKSAHLEIRFDIPPDQKGILIGQNDMTQSLIAIIDNAHELLEEIERQRETPPEDYWLEFRFTGLTPDKTSSVMLVRDNLPWPDIDPKGGMRQFFMYCRKYSAIYEYKPQTTDKFTKLRVLYKIDHIGEGHEYR